MNTDLNAVTERVIGCAYAVSNELGAGFLETVYEKSLALELDQAGLQFQTQPALDVTYRGKTVGTYIPDFVVENTVILEIKAISNLLSEHEAQLLNYLKVSGIRAGLLINFGRPRIQIKRMML